MCAELYKVYMFDSQVAMKVLLDVCLIADCDCLFFSWTFFKLVKIVFSNYDNLIVELLKLGTVDNL